MGHDAWSQRVDRSPDAGGQAHEVRRRRIGKAAELVEVPAAAEAGTLAPQDDLGDGGYRRRPAPAFEEPIAEVRFSALRTSTRFRTSSSWSPWRSTLTAGPTSVVGPPNRVGGLPLLPPGRPAGGSRWRTPPPGAGERRRGLPEAQCQRGGRHRIALHHADDVVEGGHALLFGHVGQRGGHRLAGHGDHDAGYRGQAVDHAGRGRAVRGGDHHQAVGTESVRRRRGSTRAPPARRRMSWSTRMARPYRRASQPPFPAVAGSTGGSTG